MALGKDYAAQDCALARTLELVGERWTLLIVRDAFYGVRRYRDFLSHLEIPRAVLSTRLSSLTDAGLLATARYQQAPPRDEYVLTAKGRQLWPAVHALARWGEQHCAADGGPRRVFRHAGCGTLLNHSGGCTKCGTAQVPPEDVEMRPGPGSTPVPHDPVSRALLRPHRLLEPLPRSPDEAP